MMIATDPVYQVRARQEARGLKEIVSNLKMEEARTRQA